MPSKKAPKIETNKGQRKWRKWALIGINGQLISVYDTKLDAQEFKKITNRIQRVTVVEDH